MSFNPSRDIPDLSGKTILVTGGNNGLGKETILQLAQHNPQQIMMGARDRTKAETAIAEIKKTVPDANITFVEMDLADYTSIRSAAAQVLQSPRLDILINNAGMIDTTPGLTPSGYEIQFGTNHMGPALLTKLLLPKLRTTAALPGADVRVVQLSSELHMLTPKTGIQYDLLTTPMAEYGSTTRYGQSKRANLYYIKALAKRYPELTCVSLHPGVVRTGLMSPLQTAHPWLSGLIGLGMRLFFTDVKKGALGQLWAATGKKSEMRSGAYYVPLKKEVKGNKAVDDEAAAEKLWEWTEERLQKDGEGKSDAPGV